MLGVVRQWIGEQGKQLQRNLTGMFAILYGAARIFSEFFREPDPRLEDLGRGLTMGMVLSLPLIIAGVGMLAWSFRRGVSP